MSQKPLRDYQQACVDAHLRWYETRDADPLFVVPTRGGKSLIIAEFLRRALQQWPDTRAVVLTHVRELVEQNYAEFVDQWGDGGIFAPAGVYSAGLKRREVEQPITFAAIQSVWRRPNDLGPRDLVLIDEAHLIPKKGAGMYLSYLEGLRRISPHARLAGYTATPYRLAGGYLHEGAGAMFGGIAYEVTMDQLVRDGHLVPLRSKRTDAQIDLAGVKVENGEFKLDQMEERARQQGCVEAAVAEIVEWARIEKRKSWLVFCAGVDHAREVAAAMRERGVTTAEVYGDTEDDDRRIAVAAFKAGQVTALVNVQVLTTGFNAPRCDLLAMLRGTASASLFVQIMGRGMTPFEENGERKKDCLVLDFGGNVERHGPVNRVKPRHRRADGSEKPPPGVKVCPQCSSILPLDTSSCPDCGHRWAEPDLRAEHAREASWAAPFDPEAADRPREWAVDGWHFRQHEKQGRPPSLRVDYLCGMRIVSEWVCFEHEGFARRKATKWWLAHGGRFPPPETINDAVARAPGELRQPSAVVVIADGKYERVLRPVWPAPESEKIQLPTTGGVA